MKKPTLEKALRFAKRLKVLDQKTGQMIPFVLNEEQQHALKLMLRHQRVIFGKGRQIGMSTVSAFFVAIMLIMNPGLPAAVISDEQEKSEDLLKRVRDWLVALKIPLLKDNVRSCSLQNGSSLRALSAMSTSEDSESRVGRSRSYGLIWCSEQAFWRNAKAVFAALTSTAGLSAMVLIESTGAPAGDLFESLARSAIPHEEATDDCDGYVRMFFSVEMHSAYRRSPDDISDERWAELQGIGFVKRESAAWWEWKRVTDFGGDTQRTLREYPVLFEHVFTGAGQRYYKETEQVDIESVDGLEVYPVRDEPRILAAVASDGLSSCPSAFAIVGAWSGQLHAAWKRPGIEVPMFARVVERAVRKWSPSDVVIECRNPHGSELKAILATVPGIPIRTISTTEARWATLRARLREDLPHIPIGPMLFEEARRVSVDLESGNTLGEDRATGLHALAVARAWWSDHPHHEKTREPNKNKVYKSPRNRASKRVNA